MKLFDIIQQTSDAWIASLPKSDQGIARNVIKKYRWWFFSHWKEVNNLEVDVESVAEKNLESHS